MTKGSTRKEKIQIITTFVLMTLLAFLAFTFLSRAYADELRVNVSGKSNFIDEEGYPYVMVLPGQTIKLQAQRIETYGSHTNTINILSKNLTWWEDGERVSRFEETNGYTTYYYVPQGTWEYIDIEAQDYRHPYYYGFMRLINEAGQDMGYYEEDDYYYEDDYEDPNYYYDVADYYYRTEIINFPTVHVYGHTFYMLPEGYVPYRYGRFYNTSWGLRYRPDPYRYAWGWAPAYYGCVVWHPGYGRYLYYWDRTTRVTGVSLQIDLFFTNINVSFYHYNPHYSHIYDLAYGRGFRDGYIYGSNFWNHSPYIVTVAPRARFLDHRIDDVRVRKIKTKDVRTMFNQRMGRKDAYFSKLKKTKVRSYSKREFKNAFNREVVKARGKSGSKRLGNNTNPYIKRSSSKSNSRRSSGIKRSTGKSNNTNRGYIKRSSGSTKRSTVTTKRPAVKRSTTNTKRPSVKRSTTNTKRPSVKRSTTSTKRPSVKRSTTNTKRPSVKRSTTNTKRPSVKRSNGSTKRSGTVKRSSGSTKKSSGKRKKK